ncbi:DUF488 domain containing protein [Lysobacter dokdonensis DS-58]|uniref:DUF488 domain containing protein n=1 Tax=Lysobacter dokdonensis DS-58 TaxID=1300345 RepID=A0A0A2WHP1_9GAMM|nr:DUF4426 domain-containing protein [Lysobacter dokdonensis]KGQ17780.1 DUF488 domain containing protein [Lysobacter dokdonensis DS-58]
MRTIERMAVAMIVGSLAACGGGSAPTPAHPAPPPAELHVGDLHLHATAVNTMALPERVTKSYGIARGEQTWMLLVTVRQGEEGRDVAVPANVVATARDLGGRRIGIPMRELRLDGGLIDNVGTFSISPPDTLQFTVDVTPANGPTRTLEFTREVAK